MKMRWVSFLSWWWLVLMCGEVAHGATLRDLMMKDDSISLFRGACANLGLLNLDLDDPTQVFTVLAPTDAAINANPFFKLYLEGVDDDPQPRYKDHLLPSVQMHLVEGQALIKSQIFDGSRDSLATMLQTVTVNQAQNTISGANILKADNMATNGVLHVIDKILQPDFYSRTLENLERQPEFGPDWLDRISLVSIVDFTDSRVELRWLLPTGQTQVGCRIRALNRIGLFYLPKTINRSPEIKFGEFMNASFKNETIKYLVQYSMIRRNVYLNEIPNGHEEWYMSWVGCSHMFITKSNTGTLCFNDGCVVSAPDPLQFIANNGIGYVVDKCIVCSGGAMLVQYAAAYSMTWLMSDSAMFWSSSEWNLRNLSMSVGDGRPLTILAATNDAFVVFNSDDKSRISTDKWKQHQWDFLRHNILPGAYTRQDFINLWYNKSKGKPFNITSWSGQNVTFNYNETTRKVMVQGGGSNQGRRDGPWGELGLYDLKGVDGYVHFVTVLPLPYSITHSAYDLAKEWANYSTQVTFIDTVFLREDLKRLSPITVMYAPNSDWDNKVIQLADISKSVLENMIFKDLQWCATLRSLVGKRIESHNGQSWKISVNATTNMPCFDTEQVFGGPVRRSCITECDILCRNGIVHKLDSVMFFQVPETAGPQPPTIPTASNPSQPNFYKAPTQKLPGWKLPRPTFYGPAWPSYLFKTDEGYSQSGGIPSMHSLHFPLLISAVVGLVTVGMELW